jgi:glycosyltransferase involved in cell wall biosynthesis
LRLTLFMTRGMSLGGWERVGTIDRELALYRWLRERGVEVGVVTYGGPEDHRYADRLPGLVVLSNRWRLPESWYGYLAPWLHAGWLRRSHVLKTNQTDGARLALRAARLWRKPLVARCGYMWSDFRAREEGADSPGTREALALESEVFAAADHVVVTTVVMAEQVARRIEGGAAKTAVIPNYVDCGLFRPTNSTSKDTDVMFVGRLSDQKNVAGLLEAVETPVVSLTVVGDGPQRELLERARSRLGERLQWFDHVPHADLPALMGRARVFALPSLWEGHPKALIEAMAAGMAVVGADSPGIREVVRHGETGWLCGTGAESIRQEIMHLLDRPELRRRLGRNARTYAVENFALDRIAEREFALLREVAGKSGEGL